ncbi:MAG TPA: RagB/SusD family nutrient uptake outer membrane protein, partial [Pseudobacter sp.]|nr:RagB/SusD family nutrient uptake outer membrane protein [Pseudobacter sp.]
MKKYLIYGCLLTSLLGGGCNKMLEEEPRAILTPEFLKTEKGVRKGLDAAYGGTRYVWGSQDLFVYLAGGTDEFVKGVDGNTDLNSYTSNFTPGQGSGNQIWLQCYRWINACNGIIANAPAIDMAEADKKRIIAEAKFLRAMFYSTLVQFWRDITVSTDYITTSVTSAKRNSLAESIGVVINDLKEAIVDLPAGPKSAGLLPGKANAAAARHLLGRMYLYRASTPAAQPTDKEDAYQTLKGLIDERNNAGISLLTDFGDVFKEGNEANTEVLFAVQHTSNYAFNGPNNSTVGDNIMNHMFIGQYDKRNTMIRSMDYG